MWCITLRNYIFFVYIQHQVPSARFEQHVKNNSTGFPLIHTYIHTYMHDTYIHTYIHTYMHAYIHREIILRRFQEYSNFIPQSKMMMISKLINSVCLIRRIWRSRAWIILIKVGILELALYRIITLLLDSFLFHITQTLLNKLYLIAS